MNYAFLPCMELIVATLHACLSSVITANFMQNSEWCTENHKNLLYAFQMWTITSCVRV